MNDQVAEIKSKVDIVSIIGERIELKKAGRNFKAPCPFHGEKTPSFMVSPELQIFKCFGCGEAGDVYNFLEKYEGMEFPEALKYLAERAGVKLERANFGPTSDKEKLIEINSQALRFYNYLLLNHPLGKKALEYLIKDRGIKKESIEEFKLGFSPENSMALKKFLVDKKKFAPADVERAGIGIVRGQDIYDRFNGRIVFPLFDHRGNVLGFAGRVLPWDKRDTGKYINSPETPLYHKSNVLYGLNVTRPLIKKKGVAIVVEGELDAISSWQVGVKNVVAIKGSALTEEQVRLLSRFAGKFILALDSDLAGDAAARRGLAIAGNLGVEVRVAKMTGYKDPDEAARANPESYKNDLIKSEGVWDFLIDSVFSRFKGITGGQKAKISREVSPILAGIDDKIVQSHYANLVARKLGVALEAVIEEISKVQKADTGQKIAEIKKEVARGRKEILEERLMALAFGSDPKVLLSPDFVASVSTPIFVKILEEYMKFPKKKAFSVTEFAGSLPGELFEGFSKIILNAQQDESSDPSQIGKELDLVAKELKILSIRDNLKLLAIEMRQMEEAGEKIKLLKTQNKFNKLAAKLSGFEEDAGSSIIFRE